MIPHLIGKEYITLFVNGKTNTIPSTHINFNNIVQAIKDKDWDAVPALLNVTESIAKFGKGLITIDSGVIKYNGEVLHNTLVDRILDMISEGFDVSPMVVFLENLMNNTSKRVVDELYGFLEAAKIPLTEDGCFLAYKRVNHDFKDFYTGKVDHSVGSTPSMPRNRVDEDKDRTCSYGLHFCSFNYLPSYHSNSGKVVIVKVNPADVVAIPSDYDNTKGRCCRYEVIGVHEEGEKKEAFTKSVEPGVVISVTPVAPVKPAVSSYTEDYNEGLVAGKTVAEKFLARGTLSTFNQTKADRKVGKKPAGFADGFKDGYKEVYTLYESKLKADAEAKRTAELKVKENAAKNAYDVGFTLGKNDYAAGKPYSVHTHSRVVANRDSFEDGYYDGFYS